MNIYDGLYYFRQIQPLGDGGRWGITDINNILTMSKEISTTIGSIP
ncbi:MAG: hypothetical protein JO327_13155 [Nitrososphaeraceae archaeon]|nr:hypothetical protein [Nitrososphaeraceae archaeon]MBV9669063.1 hypothetical protein [Nitrososphaeraceae archaeon]